MSGSTRRSPSDGSALQAGARVAALMIALACATSCATIARRFDGLEIRREGEPLVVLRQRFEVGGSFATAPDFRVQKITLPWIALGYQFGEVVSGVRI